MRFSRSMTRPAALLGALALFCALLAQSAATPSGATAAETTFTFKGGGWGHGIGLSQYGARGYALKGWKHDAILAHYYQGTKLVTKPTVTMKVNLDANGDGRSQWWIKSGTDTSPTVQQLSDAEKSVTLAASKSFWIVTTNGDTSVRDDYSYVSTDPDTGAKTTRHKPGASVKSFAGGCQVSSGGIVQMLGGSGPFAHAGVKWRGVIRFSPTSSTASISRAVNYVDIEKYLYGVVPRESPSSWPTEALKAQAVAARSYAYQDGVNGHTLYCTTRSQVYNGYKGPKGGEVASTNAAVNATKGQLVWYGDAKQPVKTYFSASSGGHTANIEDVWTGATARPYYVGVPDADESSPYFTWTSGPHTAASVTAKVRAKDSASGGLDYSEPSPATIVAIATERATSGYARHATLTWSNGKRHRITGDALRNAMGLRSTKFSVTRTLPVVEPTRYQNTDTRLAWYGPWTDKVSSDYSASSLRVSSIKNSSGTIAFTGTSIALVGSTGPSSGKAAILVDGTQVATVDLYSASSKHRETIIKRSGLKSGTHTLTVKVLKERSANSAGYEVCIDAFDVVGSIATATARRTRYEQTDDRLARLGEWKTYNHSSLSAGSQLYTTQKKARFYVTFYGNEVRWIAKAGPSYGAARVSIDGSVPQTVTITSAKTEYEKEVFARSGLSQSVPHTLVIEALGAGSGGTAGYTDVDAFDIRGGWLLPAVVPTVTVQESNSAITWAGAWGSATDKRLLGGAHRWSSKAGASATLTFEGSRIAWIGKRAGWYGKARIYLDGIPVATVDQYHPSSAFRRTLWSSDRLAPGRHTLKIVVTGEHSAMSDGATVAIDAFEVAGRTLAR